MSPLLLIPVAAALSLSAQNQKLNAPLVSNRAVTDFLVSPDDACVVYRADQDANDVFELYGVPSDGSQGPVKLSGALVAGGDVAIPWLIDPASVRIVYRADQETDGLDQLFSVPLDGSQLPIRLSDPAEGSVASYKLSPDGARVVYRVNAGFSGGALYSVPLDGSQAPTQLAPGFVASGTNYRISPDSTRVCLAGGPVGPSSGYAVYSVPTDGSQGAVQLSMSGGWGGLEPQFCSNGARVSYVHAPWVSGTPSKLFSVPVDGPSSASIELSGALVAGGNVASASSNFAHKISSDGARAVYRADQETDEVFELFSVPCAGGQSPVKLNGPLVSGGDVGYPVSPAPDGIMISPDSSRVLYLADEETDGRNELYSVPIAGGARVKLNQPLPSGSVGSSYAIAQDSSRVVFAVPTSPGFAIDSAPLDGSLPAVRITPSPTAGGSSQQIKISADSARVGYMGDQEMSGVTELFSAPIDGSGSSTKVNAPLVTGGDVKSFSISSDGRRFVYLADQDSDNINELYTTKMRSTPRPRVSSSAPSAPGRSVPVP